MSVLHKFFFAVLCAFSAFQAFGQAARTPFSSFGIGEPYGNALINHQGMAGVGVAQPNFYFINNQNPALLIYNSLNTAFQAGVIMERRTINSDTLSETSKGGNMNYLVTAFPLKPGKWTTSVGLMPYTSVNYLLQYEDHVVGRPEEVTVTEDGSGGLTQLYWSNGVRIARSLSVGVKASYIFSSIVKTYKNQLIESPQPINYLGAIREKTYVKDFTFGTGISFSKDSLFSRGRYRLSVGAVYNFATNLDATMTEVMYRETQAGDTSSTRVINSLAGYYSVPQSFTAGISLSRGLRWNIGTEFTYQDWADFRDVSGKADRMQASWRAAVGGEVTPDPFSTDNYLKRITYRAGVSMEQNPFLANGNPVNDLGINFGFTLPSGRYNSVDFAFKYGKRGDKSENILEENYFKIYFGITFNDQWFIKRRYD